MPSGVARASWSRWERRLASPPVFGQDPARPAKLDLYGDPLPIGAVARMGSVRFHQPSEIIDLAFSPDSKTILVAGDEGKKRLARLLDRDTGKELLRFPITRDSSQGFLRSMRFSPDGHTVALNFSRCVDLYNVQSGKLLRTFGGEHEILSCAFSPDGKVLAVGSMERKEDNPIRVWEVETGRELAPFAGYGASLRDLAFSADGKRLCSGPLGGQYETRDKDCHAICVWDVATRKKLAEVGCVGNEVAFAPNGEFIAFDSIGVRVVAVPSGQTICRIPARVRPLPSRPTARPWRCSTRSVSCHCGTPPRASRSAAIRDTWGCTLALPASPRTVSVWP